MNVELPEWASPIVEAAVAADIRPGWWSVAVWPENGAPWIAGTYERSAVAQGRATRMGVDGTRAYLVKRHSAGITVYIQRDVVLGTVSA